MTVDFPKRIEFEDHRVLQASDLSEQHEYHIQRRWQHNLAMHSWGILCGLTIQIDVADAQSLKFQIRPGMAIDGYGREIVLTKQVFAPSKQQMLDPGMSYDVWILYRTLSTSEPLDAVGDTCQFAKEGLSRIDEIPEILIRPTTERQSGSVTRPTGVPISDLQFQPTQPMRFDDNNRWPVFIGRIECVSNKWVLDESERYYGGLKAERIEFPGEATPLTPEQKDSNPQRIARTMIINGGHPGNSDLTFAVAEVPSDFDLNQSQRSLEELRTPISIRSRQQTTTDAKGQSTSDSEIRFNADRLISQGDLVLKDGSSLEFEPTAIQDKPGALPPASWGIFRQLHLPSKLNDEFGDVLHFSMPEDERGTNRISFGTTSEDGTFKPILEVRSNQTVEIHGSLTVHGAITGVLSQVPFEPEKLLALASQELTNEIEKREAGTQKEILKAVFLGSSKVESADLADTITSFPKAKALYGELLGPSIDALDVQVVATKVTTNAKANDFYKALVDPLVSNVEAALLANAVDEIGDQGKKKDAITGIVGKVDRGFVVDAVIAKSDGQLFEDLFPTLLNKLEASKIASGIQSTSTANRKGIHKAVASNDDFISDLTVAIRQELVKKLAENAQKDFIDGGFKATNFSAMIKAICKDAAKSRALVDSLPTDEETLSALKANLAGHTEALVAFVNAVTDAQPAPPPPVPDQPEQ